MKSLRSLSLLVVALVIALVAPGFAQAAVAPPKDPPGIRATKSYKVLRVKVANLAAKRTTPASAARKAQLRQNLSVQRGKVVAVAGSLYTKRLKFIAYQSAKQLAAKVDKIEGALAKEVKQLAETRDGRIANLNRARRHDVKSSRTRFNTRIADLSDERQELRQKLVKTKNPAKRTVLTEEISELTARIGMLNTQKQQALDVIVSEYAERLQAVQARYARLIREAKVAAAAALQEARLVVKRRQETRNAGTHTRRTREIALVTALYGKGVASIDQMPEPTPPTP